MSELKEALKMILKDPLGLAWMVFCVGWIVACITLLIFG